MTLTTPPPAPPTWTDPDASAAGTPPPYRGPGAGGEPADVRAPSSHPANGRTPAWRRLVDLMAVLGLGVAAAWGFSTIYGGTTWLVVAGAGLVAGGFVGWLGAARQAGALVIFVSTAAAYLLLSGVALPDKAIAGVLPSPASVSGAARTSVTGWVEVLTTSAPVGGVGDLMAIPLLCGVLVAVLATSAALRTRALLVPMLPMAALLALTVLFGTSRPANEWVQGGVVVVGLVSWFSFRRSGTRRSTSARVLVTRLVGSAVMLGLAGGAAGLGLADRLLGTDAKRVTLR